MAKNNGGNECPDEFDFFDDWDFAPYEDADSTCGNNLAGFGADELAGEVFDEEDDEEFAKLFSAFDEVAVSAEQRESTLSYVLAHDDPKLSRAKADAHMRRPARRSGFRMRVGIIAACLAVVIAGAASWLLPVSSVEVTGDDYAVKLGMNVFGVAVTAQAEDELGQEVLDQTDVRNLGSDDARVRLQETFERLYPELTPESKQDTSPEPANNAQGLSGGAGNASVSDPSGTPGMAANNSATEASSAQQQQGGQNVAQEPERQLLMADPQDRESAQEDGGAQPSVQPDQQTQSAQKQEQTTYQMDQPDEGGQLDQWSQPGQQQGEPPQQHTQQVDADKSIEPDAGTDMSSATSSDGLRSGSGEL